MTTIAAYTFGGITRPELILDPQGNIVLTPAAEAFASIYGLKALYLGCPPNTPWPPVPDGLTTPVDTNAAANTVAEGAAVNTPVNVTVSATSLIGTVTYSLIGDSSGGGFKINATTGVVTVADPTKIDFESAPGHAYTITAQASDGIITSSQTFTIGVTDVAPSTPVDSNAAANAVAEGAAAGTLVGLTVSSTDVNGPGVHYSLTADSSGGGFTIDATTGVVTVADPTKIDYESAPGHAYTVTAQASDGTLTSSQTFTINVTDVPLPVPTDANPAANAVAEGAAVNTLVGITAQAIDPNGPATTYSLTGDTSGGGFKIDPVTGVVSVADPTKIDFESAPGHAYSITVKADDGLANTSQTFTIGVTDVAPATPVDSNAAANTVAEGAAAGTAVGVTASSTDINGGTVTYSLTADSSGGGFTINATTGVVTVADPTKIDFESAAGHAYTVTAQASDGTLASSQTFTINVTDVAPSTPVDGNAAANAVAEAASAGTAVGLTASSTDVNGPAVTYSLTADTSGGGFTINATTGVVTVADPTKIDFESAAGHAYSVTAQASDGTLTSSQTFTINVTDVAPSAPVDSDATANSVAEGAAAGTTVGVTASSTDVNGPAVTYSLTGDTSGGGFTIDATTGVVTVADPTKIDFETAAGHAYTVTAQASDGTLASTQTFTINVTDVAPSTPVDSDATANSVVEGAANGSTVGITASSTDVNGPAVTYSLTADSSGGGFTINATTGVVTVADSTKIDYESAPGHAYTVTAQASDGTLASSQTFTIGVTNAAPSTPVDGNAAANSVAEGAAAGTAVGLTVSSTDVNGPAVTYSLTGDTSGGGFTIDATTGVVTVADPTKIDFESAAGHAYSVTAQASDGILTSSQSFTINVTDVAPSTPVDSDATANSIVEGAANGSTVGVTASSTDVNGPAVTYSLTGDTSGGGFTINATTGVVTVADSTKIDFETSGPTHSYTVTAQASDGTLASTQTFTINVTDVAPTTPLDSDAATNRVSQGALVGTYTGLTASSTDVNGPAVTYSLIGDTSGGGFTVDSVTGQVKVANSADIVFNAGSPTYDVTVQASDGTLTSQQTFTINVIQNTPPVANNDSISATEAGGANNVVPGHDPSGNVILGTGDAGAVQDTDAEDPSTALTVVAVHTGPEGGSTGTGTVGSPLIGLHGTLTLGSTGAYTYTVNQTDAQVQALHTAADTLTDTFNYTIQDTGGLQDTASITFTIHGANDLPVAVADTGTMTEDDAPTSFNVIANDSQDPDSTATNAITLGPGSITVTGPAGETFVNTDATASIVANQVQVTLNNAHFQQLAVGEHATVTVPYTLTGDAADTSSANLVVTVNGVNDVPVAVDDSGSMTEDQSGHAFTVLTNDTLDADHGAPNNVTTGAVTNLVAPAGENIDTSDVSVSVNGSNQIVVNLGSDFQHMQDGQTTTFDIPYTLHGDQAGDTSTATLHVTVNGVNDAPVASNFTFNGVNSATGNTDLVVNDPTDGAPSPTGPFKLITASLLSGASDVDGPGPLIVVAGNIATAHGGSVTMQSDGDFIYKPAVGYIGSDSFTYQVSDQNGGASGVGLGTGTVTINVAAPKVWYVNADAATDGDGSSENPFNNLSHFNGAGGVDGAGDTIFLETSTAHYTGGLTLENNEQLISQSAGLVVPDGGGGAGTVTLVSASGANAVVDGGVVLASGNTIEGVDFGTNAGGFALSGSSVGTVHVNDTTSGLINNASGGAVSIGGSSNVLNMDFSSVTSGGGTNGITLANASGTFHAHGGTISGASGADVSLSGGSVNFTHDGAITDATGTMVSISGMTGGTQSFTGSLSGGAVSLTSNTGATMGFSGGLAIDTSGTNGTGFAATGGGTVTVTGSNNTINSGQGTGLDVANTTIGSNDLIFKSISSSGGSANGIILDTTGSSGGLHVTGTGTTAGTGGTIANKVGSDGSTTQGTGIYLNNTHDVQLSNMNLHDFQNFGVFGNSVSGFTLDHSTVNATASGTATNGTVQGSPNNEGSLYFTELTGTANITNDTIADGETSDLAVTNNVSGSSLTLNVSDSTFTGRDSATLGATVQEVLLQAGTNAGDSPSITANFLRNTMTNNDARDLQAITNGAASMVVNIGQNGVAGSGGSFDGMPAAMLDLDHNSTGDYSFNVQNATFNVGNFNGQTGASLPINVFNGSASGSGSTFQGRIVQNTVNGGNNPGGGFDGIELTGSGPGTMTVEVDHNTVDNISGTGIRYTGAQNSAANHTNLTITNNTVNMASNANDSFGIQVSAQASSTASSVVELDLAGNTVTNDTASPDYRVDSRFSGSLVEMPGYSGGSQDLTAIKAFVAGNNGTTSTEVSASTGLAPGGNFGNTPGGAAVPLPGNAQPLDAAPGGVQASSPTVGEMHLTQTELNSVIAAAIAQWAAAGASASQLADLHSLVFSVADLSGSTVSEQTAGHLTVDVNAAGHGWYIDPTPSDNFEFTHALNAAGTDLLTDPSTAAAGHLDLLTAVTHEMGHELGLPDLTSSSSVNDIMYVYLVDGERRLPSAADVALTHSAAPTGPVQAPAPLPTQQQVPADPTLDKKGSPPPGPSTPPPAGDNFTFHANPPAQPPAPPQGNLVVTSAPPFLDEKGGAAPPDPLHDLFSGLVNAQPSPPDGGSHAGQPIADPLSPPVTLLQHDFHLL